MYDTVQQALQALATHNGLARILIIACAAVLVYLMGVAWLAIAARQESRLTLITAARVVALGALAYLLAKLLGHIIADPRPYIVTHTRPLIPTAHDNGFPSDHTVLAAMLTASLAWVDRRYIALFSIGTLLVLIGRLGIGAHHTIDVIGAVVIVVVAAAIVQLIPFPTAWERPLHSLLPGRPATDRADMATMGDRAGARDDERPRARG